MTTRREVLIGAAALAAGAEAACAAPLYGFEPPISVWLLTRQQIEDTPHWGPPSAWPSRLDVIGYHHCMPQLDRLELVRQLRARYAHPYMAERWRPETDTLLVVVGEHEHVAALERRWQETARGF
jgi:hypothetical protein